MLFLSVACAAQMQILKVLNSMSNTPKDPETIALQNACLKSHLEIAELMAFNTGDEQETIQDLEKIEYTIASLTIKLNDYVGPTH